LIAENVQYHINVHQHNPMKPSDCMSILKHNLKKLKTHLSTRAFQHLVFTPHFISFFYWLLPLTHYTPAHKLFIFGSLCVSMVDLQMTHGRDLQFDLTTPRW